MRRAGLFLLTVAFLFLMTGCGGQSTASNPSTKFSPATVPVGLTVTDTPPDGVTVLFFQLSITGASLSPGDVSLLSSTYPVSINVSQLQTEAAFLGSMNVTAGTYTGLTLTVANPQLTIYNGTGSAIGTCATNTVCQLTPTTTPLTLSFTSSPFPVTLAANSPLAFKFDIHLDTVIQPDLTVNLAAPNGVTLSELPPLGTGKTCPAIGKLRGIVQTVTTSPSNQFTMQSFFGKTFTILTNSSTTYNFPSSVCSTNDFTCLAQNQVVKVTVSLQSDGSLLATEVDYVQLASQLSVEGNIIGLQTSGGNTIIDLIIQRNPSDDKSGELPLGHHARITVPSSGVTYAIDWSGFTPPSGLSFASASDLQVGQEVMVMVQGSVSTTSTTSTNSGASTLFGWPAVTFTASSISLEPGQITGKVSAVDASSLDFTLKTFPCYFVPKSATPGAPPTWAPVSIAVQTTSATTFKNFPTNDITGVAVGNVVSVHGWLFSTPNGSTASTVAADEVLLRPGPMPFF